MLPCSKRAGGLQEPGRGHRLHNWFKLAKGTFRVIKCHVEQKYWGKLTGGQWIAAWQLIGHWVMSTPLCTTYFPYSFIIITILLSFSVLLSCLYLNPGVLPFFSNFLSYPTVGQWGVCPARLNPNNPLWGPVWVLTGWDNHRSDQNMLKQTCYKHLLY